MQHSPRNPRIRQRTRPGVWGAHPPTTKTAPARLAARTPASICEPLDSSKLILEAEKSEAAEPKGFKTLYVAAKDSPKAFKAL